MAAETLTGTRAAAAFPVFQASGSGAVAAAYGSYSVAANVEDGDIFELCKVPKDAVIVMGWFFASDMDTGAEALDIDAGWAANGTDAADPDGLVNGGVLTGDAITDLVAAGINVRPFDMSGGPITFAAETTLQAEANAAATTFAAGTIYICALYVVP